MKIIAKVSKGTLMFMSNRDLPSYGKALAWAFVFFVWVIAISLLACVSAFLWIKLCNFI